MSDMLLKPFMFQAPDLPFGDDTSEQKSKKLFDVS
jgi:hypothetical protein